MNNWHPRAVPSAGSRHLTSNLPEKMKERFLDQSGYTVDGGLLEILRNATGDCGLLSEMRCAGEAIQGSTQA